MSYAGIKAKIPLGDVGLLTDIAPDKCPPNSLIGANNVCFTKGTVEKAPGTIKWNATPLSAGIIAAHYWEPNVDVHRMIAATSDGSIYKGRDRKFITTAATGLGVLTPNCVFAEGGIEAANASRKLFLFTGGNSNPQVMTADGDTFRVITSPSVDWTVGNYPKFGLVHRARLFAFAGQQYYASDTANHENFTSNYLTGAIYPGEGGELRGGFVFKGRLFAFKNGGFVYWFNDSDTSSTNWYWQKIASNFGLSAPNACVEVLNDMFSGNTNGTITSYSATQSLGNIDAADIMQQLQFESYLRSTTSKAGVPEQHLLYYPEKKLMFATYRSSYQTHNDMLVVFDFGKQQVRPSYWIKGSPQCLALYKDMNQIQRPMYGDKDGYLMLMDAEDRTEGGTAYTGSFQTPHLDFSHLDPSLSTLNKHFDFLAVHYIPESTGQLSCDYYIDGRYIDTITFDMIQYTRPELGVLTLNTDRMAQPTPETCIRKINGTGRTFSAKFYQAGSNQSFQVPAITVMLRPGAEQAQQV